MPGPVSDSYDPEWGTGATAADIADAIDTMYDRVSGVLGHREPKDIRTLVYEDAVLTEPLPATLTEWEWRIIRFCLERAGESL